MTTRVLVRVRFPKNYIFIMDELVKAGQFPSRSEAIRQMAMIGLVEYAKRKGAV
jgi:metal-responsive CopG/Arc/MetJ family transcriptional regulator